MYKNNKTGCFADEKFTENYVEMTPEETAWFEKYQGNGFMVVDGECVINPNYPKELEQAENQIRIDKIKAELESIDKQRTRAIAEPEIKNEATGETWLKYYNNQVKALREELKALESEDENVE
ncbi:MAG: hypothetical protein OSJ27_09490 [Candidatus Gastranaerophilales bacterium]|nr:hypothetical protein [Candidatus Gastranaerophilales bacterium]